MVPVVAVMSPVILAALAVTIPAADTLNCVPRPMPVVPMNTPVLSSLNAVLVPLVKLVAIVNPPTVPVLAVMSPVILAALAVNAPTGLTKNAFEDDIEPLLFKVTLPPVSLLELIVQPPMVPVVAVISPVILAALAVI